MYKKILIILFVIILLIISNITYSTFKHRSIENQLNHIDSSLVDGLYTTRLTFNGIQPILGYEYYTEPNCLYIFKTDFKFKIKDVKVKPINNAKCKKIIYKTYFKVNTDNFESDDLYMKKHS